MINGAQSSATIQANHKAKRGGGLTEKADTGKGVVLIAAQRPTQTFACGQLSSGRGPGQPKSVPGISSFSSHVQALVRILSRSIKAEAAESEKCSSLPMTVAQPSWIDSFPQSGGGRRSAAHRLMRFPLSSGFTAAPSPRLVSHFRPAAVTFFASPTFTPRSQLYLPPGWKTDPGWRT